MTKPVSKSNYRERIEPSKGVIDWKVTAENLRKQSDGMNKRYEILEIYTKKIEGRAKELEEQKKRFADEQAMKNEKLRKEIMKDKEIRVRDILIKQMQMELRKQKEVSKIHDVQYRKEQEFTAIKTSNKIPVVIINDFDKDTIMFAHRDYGLKGQVVWFRALKDSTQALNALKDLSPKVVLNSLNEDANDDIKRGGILVIEVKPEIHEFYGSVSSDQLTNSLKEKERKDFLTWLDNYKRRDV
jgi:predicted RNase H-like nuclease (RuvC/YqgF family)